jgi:hypothetical protein
MADRQEAFRHAEAPAWVAEQRMAAVVAERMAAVVDTANRSFVTFLVALKFENGEKPYAANDAELRQISQGQSSCIGRGRCPFDGVLSHTFHGTTSRPENVFIAGRRQQRTRHGSAE